MVLSVNVLIKCDNNRRMRGYCMGGVETGGLRWDEMGSVRWCVLSVVMK